MSVSIAAWQHFSEMSPKAKAISIGGVGAVNVDDVFKVAVSGLNVHIDGAAADRLRKEEAKKFEAEPKPSARAASAWYAPAAHFGWGWCPCVASLLVSVL